MKAAELFKEDPASLFLRARNQALEMDTCFTTVIHPDTTCTLKPQCQHCNWRSRERSHENYRRRMAESELVERAVQSERDGFESLYLATGCVGADLPEYLYDYVRAVKRATTSIPVYGMFGAVSHRSLSLLAEAGMDGIWCGIETPNREIFARVRPGDSLDARINTLVHARELGMKTWTGFILGFGESREDVASGIELLATLSPDRIHFSIFNPTPFTEMEREASLNQPYWTATVIAVARLYLGNIDIFNQYHTAEWGFRAGCNGVLSPSTYLPIPVKEMGRLRGIRSALCRLPHG